MIISTLSSNKILRRWTKQEISFIEKNYSILTSNEMANLLNRSISSVGGKLHFSGITNRLNKIAFKNRKLKSEHKEKIRLAQIGKKHPHSVETRMKIGNSNRGKKSHFWKGGVSKLNSLLRQSVEYKIWRSFVFKRDKYRCQQCGINNDTLESHHEIPFSIIMKQNNIINFDSAIRCKYLWDVANGRTLCFDCHVQTDSYGNKSFKK